jgi:hypothetical protein
MLLIFDILLALQQFNLTLIVYPGKQNMVGFDMLDNFTEMTANKIPP